MTGSAHAKTIINAKQGSVCSALNILGGIVEKLVRNPVEVNTGMWAPIEIAVHLATPSNHKKVQLLSVKLNTQTLAATVGNRRQEKTRFVLFWSIR